MFILIKMSLEVHLRFEKPVSLVSIYIHTKVSMLFIRQEDIKIAVAQ